MNKISTLIGGPGESGIHQILSGGRHVQNMLDAPTSESASGKYFDIISFDPRGVNNTTPALKCYPDAFNQQSWLLRYLDYGLLWDSESVIGMEWAKFEAQGASCAKESGDGEMVRFVNTAQVVEDMVALVEAHGEWRAEEARKNISIQPHLSAAQKNEIIERTSWEKGLEPLQYWGLSYGTLLGSTFAAMHPSRSHRIVLDGVLEPEDYYAGTRLKNLQDSDMIITKFCEYCFLAGPEKCPLWTGTSGKDVEERFERTMMGLKTDPIAVAVVGRGPEVVGFGDMYLWMLTGMFIVPHNPVQSWNTFVLPSCLSSIARPPVYCCIDFPSSHVFPIQLRRILLLPRRLGRKQKRNRNRRDQTIDPRPRSPESRLCPHGKLHDKQRLHLGFWPRTIHLVHGFRRQKRQFDQARIPSLPERAEGTE